MECKSEIPIQLNTLLLWLSIHVCVCNNVHTVYKFANWFQSLADGSISTFFVLYFIFLIFFRLPFNIAPKSTPNSDAMWFLPIEMCFSPNCAIVQLCTFYVWQSICFPFFLSFIPYFILPVFFIDGYRIYSIFSLSFYEMISIMDSI